MMKGDDEKNLLIIAGSSSDGGAGVQIDLKTAHSLGIYATTAITCLTAQNTRGVNKIENTSIFEEQLEAILDDIEISCIKIGLVPEKSYFESFEKVCKNIPFVLDPVMTAEADDYNFQVQLESIIEMAKKKECLICTPNLIEARKLSGIEVNSVESAEICLKKLDQMGIKRVIVKGIIKMEKIIDIGNLDGKRMFFSKERMPFRYHGSGCCFATAIACYYLKERNIENALELAEQFIEKAIRMAKKKGKGDLMIVMP